MVKAINTPAYGSDLMAEMLQRLGFRYIALNPGASFRGLHDSLVNHLGNRNPELILCCHEEIAVAVAHGYAKASGEPMAVATHNIVGLQHAAMAIFNAWCDRVPMMILGGTGPMDAIKRRPQIDWVHTALVQGNAVRDYVKWDDQPYSLASMPESFLRGYRVMMTPPTGPVYICLDVEMQETTDIGSIELPPADRFRPMVPPSPDPAALEEVANLLTKAEKPVILADFVGRQPEAVQLLVQLAELLEAPVIDLGNSFNFPSSHPLDLKGDEKAAMAGADLVLGLEVQDLYGAIYQVDRQTRDMKPLVPSTAKIVHIGNYELFHRSWAADMQRLCPVDLSIAGDPKGALIALVELCAEKLEQGSARARAARRVELEKTKRATSAGWWAEARQSSAVMPIPPAWLAAELWELLKGEDWVLVNDSLKGWPRRLWNFNKPYQFIGGSGGAGLGYGPGASLGAALAHQGAGRVCVSIDGDGDFLFTPQVLWTAAHHRIPLLMVLYNNRSYYNSQNHAITMAKQRSRAVENSGIGNSLADPPVDFAALARSFGVYGEGPIEDPAQLRPALERALRVVKGEGTLAVVDVLTASR